MGAQMDSQWAEARTFLALTSELKLRPPKRRGIFWRGVRSEWRFFVFLEQEEETQADSVRNECFFLGGKTR